MKKIISTILMTLSLTAILGMTAFAEELSGADDWQVEFTSEKEMVSNFETKSFDDVLDYMQPGDSASFKVKVENSYSTPTDWYMTNQVLKSLEDASKTASGGAYSYMLTYTKPNGEEVSLYNSEQVGGESYLDKMQGLHEATNALENFFYLDTLAPGDVAYVRLFVLLDGETQGNDYQDTLAQIQLNFAVELPAEDGQPIYNERWEERTIPNRVPRTDGRTYTDYRIREVSTGDNTELLPLIIAAGVLGILLVVLGVVGVRLRKQMKGAQ